MLGNSLLEYKQLIKDMVDKIDNIWVLKQISRFISNMTKEG